MPWSCKRSLACAVLVAACASFAMDAHAQGGPPFLTDDPDTPGNKHFEINFGFIGARNPGTGAYQVPDVDMNYGLGDRLQLKYELPIAIEEVRSQAAAPSGPGSEPGTPGHVIGGLGESLLGIKWRFYERHVGDPMVKGRFGTGLLGLLHAPAEPAAAAGDAPGAADSPEQVTSFAVSTYPQIYLDNPTRAVPRGLVSSGPQFFLPIEVSGRIGPIRYDGDFGYHFGNRNVPQSWTRGLIVGHEFSDRTELYVEVYDAQDANRVGAGRGIGAFATGLPKQRSTTLDLGGRQALNSAKTLNLLLMGGRSFQGVTADNSQPSWIAYVGLQVLLGPKEHSR
jgi:hypothetical protein